MIKILLIASVLIMNATPCILFLGPTAQKIWVDNKRLLPTSKKWRHHPLPKGVTMQVIKKDPCSGFEFRIQIKGKKCHITRWVQGCQILHGAPVKLASYPVINCGKIKFLPTDHRTPTDKKEGFAPPRMHYFLNGKFRPIRNSCPTTKPVRRT